MILQVWGINDTESTSQGRWFALEMNAINPSVARELGQRAMVLTSDRKTHFLS